MKKLLILLLSGVMSLSLAGCSGCSVPGTDQKESTTAAPAETKEDTDTKSDEETEEKTEAKTNAPAESAKLDGKLHLIDLDDRDPSILRGVNIRGLSVGTAEGFNERKSSLTDVRCIFELNEWIDFYPDTDKDYALRVWILKHRDDQEYYNNCKFSDLMPNFANYCDLHYPADEENPDEWYWGDFYLHPEECEPGYYDFVFTYEGKAIATLLTRFYKAGELSDKSDADLEKLMRE